MSHDSLWLVVTCREALLGRLAYRMVGLVVDALRRRPMGSTELRKWFSSRIIKCEVEAVECPI
jgi:hypothetical protein